MDQIFGSISPPVSSIPSDPQTAFGTLAGTGIKLFMIVAFMSVLIYGLWGAWDWIASGGEKDKLLKAQTKITNAVIGILVVVVVIVVFEVIGVDILGLFKRTSGGWEITLPHL
ncbi:hypothetical protein GYA28_02610 [Candidatus Roizmanbacteria bacterium]|jgi:succinate dehydrogenase hydrophobic anchor subunit|nr:hypothetical protein [Candidatus Roizmanbacteria bacterium]